MRNVRSRFLIQSGRFAEDAGIADGQTRRLIMLFCRRWLTIWRASRGAAPRASAADARQSHPQTYNSIQYDANHSLWNNIEERKLDIQFSTSGWGSVAACGCSL
ncbi:hypothetical protein MJ561_16315 [Klebsiella pneumoniae]|nr:hypothetical protein MJ561_16315 [Klebsiella pneumoniae]